MPYRHETIEYRGGLFMSHSRLTPRPSGLMVITEIAHSTPKVSISKKPSNGLIVSLNPDFLERKDVIDSIECETLSEFTASGVAHWRSIINRLGSLGSVESINLNLAEDIAWTDRTTASGIVLPGGPDMDFKGYYAVPGEIEALEAMKQEVTQGLVDPTMTRGQYL